MTSPVTCLSPVLSAVQSEQFGEREKRPNQTTDGGESAAETDHWPDECDHVEYAGEQSTQTTDTDTEYH